MLPTALFFTPWSMHTNKVGLTGLAWDFLLTYLLPLSPPPPTSTSSPSTFFSFPLLLYPSPSLSLLPPVPSPSPPCPLSPPFLSFPVLCNSLSFFIIPCPSPSFSILSPPSPSFHVLPPPSSSFPSFPLLTFPSLLPSPNSVLSPLSPPSPSFQLLPTPLLPSLFLSCHPPPSPCSHSFPSLPLALIFCPSSSFPSFPFLSPPFPSFPLLPPPFLPSQSFTLLPPSNILPPLPSSLSYLPCHPPPSSCPLLPLSHWHKLVEFLYWVVQPYSSLVMLFNRTKLGLQLVSCGLLAQSILVQKYGFYYFSLFSLYFGKSFNNPHHFTPVDLSVLLALKLWI